jgi:DNA-binding CsgD family transcriptional regulator
MADRKTRTKTVQKRANGRKPSAAGTVKILTRKERNAQIYQLHLSGKTHVEISEATGLHRNTVSAAIRDMEIGTRATDTTDRLQVLDGLTFGTIEIKIRAENAAVKLDPKAEIPETRIYAERRRIFGEATPGPNVQINVGNLEEKREANLANALGKFGISVNVTG